jgi:hypothetical protein
MTVRNVLCLTQRVFHVRLGLYPCARLGEFVAQRSAAKYTDSVSGINVAPHTARPPNSTYNGLIRPIYGRADGLT